ncbi:MAG: hypothetical protein R3F07_12735 [Opitutaceae bacterium]
MAMDVDSPRGRDLMAAAQARVFEFELHFTETYKAHQGDHPAVREAACLRVLLPHLLGPISENDDFAGRIDSYPLVGLGLEQATGGPGYYCREKDEILRQMSTATVSAAERAQGLRK